MESYAVLLIASVSIHWEVINVSVIMATDWRRTSAQVWQTFPLHGKLVSELHTACEKVATLVNFFGGITGSVEHLSPRIGKLQWP